MSYPYPNDTRWHCACLQKCNAVLGSSLLILIQAKLLFKHPFEDIPDSSPCLCYRAVECSCHILRKSKLQCWRQKPHEGAWGRGEKIHVQGETQGKYA